MVRLSSIVILMILLMSGCKEDLELTGEKDFPVVFLENPKDINIDGVTLEGRMVMTQLPNHPAISYGFIIDEKFYGIDTVIVGQAESSTHFTYRFANLNIMDKSIEVQAFGKDEHNTYLSNRITIDLEGTSHEIHGFYPGEGVKGDTLVILGYRFSSERYPWVRINNSNAQVLSVNSDSIVIQVPTSMGSETGIISVHMVNQMVMATDTFKYEKPEILNLSSYTAWENDTIIITGENFSTDTKVIIGDVVTRILQLSREKLIVHLEKAPFRFKEEVVVNSDGFITSTTEPFHLLSPWKQLSIFPKRISNGISFTINNKGYAGSSFYSTRRFYEYDPITNYWTQKSDIPFLFATFSGAFAVDNRGFVLRGSQGLSEIALYEFLPDANEWIQKTDYPISNIKRINTLQVNNRVFAYGGNTDNDNAPNFFEYIPASDSWHEMAHLSGPEIFRTLAFSIDHEGYMGTGIDLSSGLLTNTMHRYNLLNDSWTEISEFPLSISEGIGFSINGIGYAGLGRKLHGENQEIYTYDPDTDQWKWVVSYPSNFTRGCISFTMGGKAYIGTGSDYPLSGAYPTHTNDFYEFDPQYLKENYQQ